MKKIALLFFSLASIIGHGQLIEDYAGVSTTSGFKDSTRLNALLNNPHGIHVTKDGTIFVADRFNHAIRKVSSTGLVTTIAGTGEIGSKDGPGLEATFHEPWDVTTDNEGNIYVADAKNNKIRKITSDGVVSTFAGTGNVGFADNPTLLSSTLYWPSGIEYDPDEDCFYIAGHLSHLIRKIDETRTISTLAGSKANFPNNFGTEDGIGSQARFQRPYGIHLSNDGFLYVADEWNSNIRRVSKEGIVTTIAGIDTADYIEGGQNSSAFNFPWDITSDSRNTLYVLDGFNDVIRTINPVTFETTLFAGKVGITGSRNDELLKSEFNGATALEYYEEKGQLFISDAFNHVIRKIDLLETPSLSIEIPPSFCQEDSIILQSDLSYYSEYFWYLNDDFFIKTETPFIKLNYDSTFTLGLIAKRSNGLFAERVNLEVNLNTDINNCDNNTDIKIVSEDDFFIIDYENITEQFPLLNDSVFERPVVLTLLPSPHASFFSSENNVLLLHSEDLLVNPVCVLTYQICFINEPFLCDTATITVRIENLPPSVFPNSLSFPNAISPNGDGINDTFVISGIESITENNFKVFNRWGQLVKEIDQYSNDWNGTQSQEEPLPEGTYFYLLKDVELDKNYSGYVLIYR